MQNTRDRNKTFSEISAHEYLLGYSEALSTALKAVGKQNVNEAAKELWAARSLDRRIFIAGNGGSASISEHMECDFQKGCHEGSTLNTRSLVSNVAVLTAIANDISYDRVFQYQLEMAVPRPGEVLILISSSGNSKNIVEAAKYATSENMVVIGMTGFDGGWLRRHCDVSLHVPFNNYGVVEDCHQALMHICAQFHYLSWKP